MGLKFRSNNIVIAPANIGNDEINKITVIEIGHKNKSI